MTNLFSPTTGQTILIVDDNPENLLVLGSLLRSSYRVKTVTSSAHALRVVAAAPQPDLLLLDICMPDMDGYAVLFHLRNDPATRDIPVIFVTAMDAPDEESYGLDLGAVDYITKPINPAIVRARVRTQLDLKLARDRLKDQNAYLEAEVTRRLQEKQMIQDVSIQALASLAEMRDTDTGNHIRRTQAYVHVLARQVQTHPRFAAVLTDQMIAVIVKSAPLHDIGKVGIPDSILLKPGKLTADEWELMKTHSRIGSDAIRMAWQGALNNLDIAQTSMPERSEIPPLFLQVAMEIAHWHHEKWDGSGYPDGLVGEAIPVSARLMALADVFDGLISRRVYKEPFPLDRVVQMIMDGRGIHFDPDIVDAFLNVRAEFEAIAAHYADSDADIHAKRAVVQGPSLISGVLHSGED